MTGDSLNRTSPRVAAGADPYTVQAGIATAQGQPTRPRPLDRNGDDEVPFTDPPRWGEGKPRRNGGRS